MTNNENLLIIAMEECAEIQQAISKALRFGLDNHNPSDKKHNNETDIMTEYYQLTSVMNMLLERGVLHPLPPIEEDLIKQFKRDNVLHYQKYSQRIGRIN